MKILYVLRHAKSDWGDSSLEDFDRPLNARGKKAAKAVGREFRKRKIKPDLVLASPAVRAQQTIERVEDGYGSKFDVEDELRIYGSEPETLVDLIKNAPDDVDRLLIVGHNPGLQDLVVKLSRPGELLDEATEKFPTAALAEIRFDTKSWNGIAPGQGILECLVRPRGL
jgi:phosphohistidine phosphatase